MRGLKTTTVLIAILVLITAWVVAVGCIVNIEGVDNRVVVFVGIPLPNGVR